jgi:uncharacterized membrane protein YozB (DUF420 family)
MKEYLAMPGFLGTYGTIGADLSFILALFFTALFLIGWYLGRKHEGRRHHTLVLWATISMLTYFTIYYLARSFGVLAIEGREGFGGSDWMYAYVFTPVITTHVLLVSIGLIMAVYMIILGFRVSSFKDGERTLKAKELKVTSKGLLKLATGSFVVLGFVALIRCRTFRCALVYVTAFIIFFIVLLLEKAIELLIPDGARRHRILGMVTMTMFFIVLFTSTLTYFFLYILYPPILPEV